jgi:hypothetical protein
LSIRPCGTSRVLLHTVKSYDIGPSRFYFPSERKVCCGFLSPLKIHRLGRVLNPQPLGPVASRLTTTGDTNCTRQFETSLRSYKRQCAAQCSDDASLMFSAPLIHRADEPTRISVCFRSDDVTQETLPAADRTDSTGLHPPWNTLIQVLC